MRLLLCLLLITATAARADEPDEEEAPAEHPGSDSPEAAHQHPFEGMRRRIQTFVVPLDQKAQPVTARVSSAVQHVLAHDQRYDVVELGQALALEATPEQTKQADEGRRLLNEGNEAAGAKSWAAAAGKYQLALTGFDRGLAAVGPREYAEAVLRLAVAEWNSGGVKPARELFAFAARLDGAERLDLRQIDPALADKLDAARSDVSALREGSLDVKAEPAGAHVVVDGVDRGAAPQHLSLAIGRHLVRVERTGFHPWAQIIDVKAKHNASPAVLLEASSTEASLSVSVAGAAEEVKGGAAGPHVTEVTERFSLERMVIGSVHTEDRKASVLLALVDPGAHRVVATRTLLVPADGSDDDTIDYEASAAARKLVDADAPAGEGAPAPGAESTRRPVMPQAASAPSADEPSLVQREPKRAVVVPAEPGTKRASSANYAAGDRLDKVEEKKEAPPKPKRKAKGLKGKTGTEEWPEDD